MISINFLFLIYLTLSIFILSLNGCPEGLAGRNCSIPCGLFFYQPNLNNNKIVGGIEAIKNSWPASVLIIFKYKTKITMNNNQTLEIPLEGRCGGSLIDPSIVLTAAHCFNRKKINFSYLNQNYSFDIITNEFYPSFESMYTVYTGIHDKESDINLPSSINLVKQIIIHENYSIDSLSQQDDIALIKLYKDVDLNDKVQLTCLPVSNSDNYPIANKNSYAVGWGTTSFGGASSNKLLNVKLTIYDDSYCSGYSNKNWNKQICAGDISGEKDSCQGDSGGSLYVIDRINGTSKYVSSGIVSHGNECGKPGFPGIYTRISSYLEWIDINSYGNKKSYLKYIFNQTNGGHSLDVWSLTLLSDGSIASASNNEIKIWDLEKGKLRFSINAFSKNPIVVGKIGYYNDFATISIKDIEIWEVNEPWFVTGNNVSYCKLKFLFNQTNGGHTSEIYILANSWPYLASASYDIKIWDITKGKLKFTFDVNNGGHSNFVSSMVALDETNLASGGRDNKVKIWDITLGKLKFTFDQTNGGHKKSVNHLAVLENGYLASSSDEIKIWDVRLGKLKFTFNQANGGHLDTVNCLFSLENGLLASGSRDYKIKIWDTIKGELKFSFDETNGGHTSYVTSLLGLENGFLASGSLDETIKIWDINKGKLKITFDKKYGHMYGSINCLWANLDFGYLISASSAKDIKVWDIKELIKR